MAKKINRNEKGGKADSGKAPVRREKKGEKPSFNRYRDDSKPSDFGGAKPRTPRSGAAKPAKRSFSRDEDRPFKRNQESEERSSETRSRTPRKPFSDKPERGEGKPREFKRSGTSEKGGRHFKKDSYQNYRGAKPAKEANPFDLDESDFEYQDRSEQPAPKTYGSSKRKSSSSRNSSKSSNDDGSVRLNKYIANAGICSRREADELISSGVVQVNGKTITEMGYKVKPTDIIKYGGQTLKKERLVYLLLNKPKDYITTVDDPEKRRTVLELVQGACRERIYPVGRLDRATTGLLLFTNDGELTKRLTHPRYGVRKIYHVELDKPLKPADLDKIAEGIELEDGPIQVDEVSFVGNGSDKREVGIELHSGRNRVVRRIFETLGYNVRKLDRVMFGPLTKKDMPRGRWRFLTEAEVGMLKMVSAGKD